MPIEIYTDLHGKEHSLSGLTAPERSTLARLKKLAAANPDWMTYSNQLMVELEKLLPASGKSRREFTQSLVYRLGQDIGSRLGVAQGKMRLSDYRDELQQHVSVEQLHGRCLQVHRAERWLRFHANHAPDCRRLPDLHRPAHCLLQVSVTARRAPG